MSSYPIVTVMPVFRYSYISFYKKNFREVFRKVFSQKLLLENFLDRFLESFQESFSKQLFWKKKSRNCFANAFQIFWQNFLFEKQCQKKISESSTGKFFQKVFSGKFFPAIFFRKKLDFFWTFWFLFKVAKVTTKCYKGYYWTYKIT